MNTPSSRFEAAVTDDVDPGGSPLLGATLHWMDGPTLRTTDALILLSSGESLLALADACPPRKSVVALRLSWPLPAAWAMVRVVRARRTRLGAWELRLRLVGSPSPTFRMLRRGDPERH